MQAAIKKYHELLVRLLREFPTAANAAMMLGDTVVDASTASADECWNVLWDKPLWANTRVSTAAPKVEALREILGGAWREMAKPHGEFEIARIGPGFAIDAFTIVGEKANLIRTKYKVAPHRLYAMVSAGKVLADRNGIRPFEDLVGKSLEDSVKQLQQELGFGWGPITILHFLTDLGLACKPDLHLVRTLRALGIAPDMVSGEVPSFDKAIAINEKVKELTMGVKGNQNPTSLREVDKALMEFSMNNLLDSTNARAP